MVQILTRLFLTIEYNSGLNSFFSVYYIIIESNNRFLLRFLHANRASFFLIFMIIHIRRRIYYISYKKFFVWNTRVILLLITMLSAFLRYVLPWRQISFWGATVITSLLTSVPKYGIIMVTWLWGRFNVRYPTLTRFYTLHFLFPLLLLALIGIHLFFLHKTGSSNPVNIRGPIKVNFYPFFFIKDLITIMFWLFMFACLVFTYPIMFMDADNWLECNPMVTPTHIKPEWYFLFAYAILRCIPVKLIRVIGILVAILIFLIKSVISVNVKYVRFRVSFTTKILFWRFTFNFVLLTFLRATHVLPHYTYMSQITSVLYFVFFIF